MRIDGRLQSPRFILRHFCIATHDLSSFRDAKIVRLLITSPLTGITHIVYRGVRRAYWCRGKGIPSHGRRFMVHGRAETSGVGIFQQKRSLFESAGQFLRDSKFHGWGSITQVRSAISALRKAAGAQVQWIATPGKVENLRMPRPQTGANATGAILASEVVQSPSAC